MPYILAAVLAFGFGSGFWAGHALTQATYEHEKTVAIEAALQKQAQDLQDTFAIEKKAIEDQHQLDLKNNFTEKEIKVYVPKIQTIKSKCSYTTGTVGLLSRAATNGSTNPAVPAATNGATANTGGVRSDVTEETGIRYTHYTINKYNEALIRHNAVIDRLEKIKCQ